MECNREIRGGFAYCRQHGYHLLKCYDPPPLPKRVEPREPELARQLALDLGG